MLNNQFVQFSFTVHYISDLGKHHFSEKFYDPTVDDVNSILDYAVNAMNCVVYSMLKRGFVAALSRKHQWM